jgi:hypothetical protein
MNLDKLSRMHLTKNITPIIAIFSTCFLVYLLTWSGHQYSIDGIVMFQYAKSLLFDHSFVMNPPVRWGQDFFVGKWPIGLTIAYIPVLGILSLTVFRGNNAIKQIPYDPSLSYNFELLENRPYRYSSFLNPTITAASAVILYFLCRRLGLSNKKSVAAALVFGLASPAAAYAKFDFAQPLASFFLLLTFLFLFRARQGANSNLIIAGISLGSTIITRPELFLLSPILVGAVYFIEDRSSNKRNDPRSDPVKQLISFVTPVVLFFLLNQYVNYQKFGSWLSMGYNPSGEFGFSIQNILTALAGNLISPGRGIFLYFPLSVLSFWGLRRLFREDRFAAWIFLTFILGSLLLYSTWKDWGAGISWGPRFFIPIIPYLAVLGFLGIGLIQKNARQYKTILISGLIILGWIVALQGLLFNFLEFYANLDLPQQVIPQGYYNFAPENSPIMMGWSQIDQPLEYDIYWMKEEIIGSGQGKHLILLFGGMFALGYAYRSWRNFFSSSDITEYSAEEQKIR